MQRGPDGKFVILVPRELERELSTVRNRDRGDPDAETGDISGGFRSNGSRMHSMLTVSRYRRGTRMRRGRFRVATMRENAVPLFSVL